MSQVDLPLAQAHPAILQNNIYQNESDTGLVARLQAAYEERLFKLEDNARIHATVRVIVQLKTFTRPESLLADDAARENQRAAIASQQSIVIDRLVQRFGLNSASIKRFATIPFMALEVTEAQLKALRSDPEVIAIEEDDKESLMLYESVPLISADVAHISGYTGAGQVVAVLDSGVIADHPFLATSVVEEACYSTNSQAPGESISLCPGGAAESIMPGSARACSPSIDSCAHGTHVTGIVAGRRGSSWPLGVKSGVAPDAQIIAIKIISLNNRPTGDSLGGIATTNESDQIRGLERVYDLKDRYKIAAVNMSVGSGIGGKSYSDPVTCDNENFARKAAIDNLRAAGIATIVASGNSGLSDSLSAPACISSAISVGAVSKLDEVPTYSNSASFLHLLAPGGDSSAPSLTTRIFSSGIVANAVSTGSDFTCGLRSDRTVACWPQDIWYATPPIGEFSEISAGFNHLCGVDSQGFVVCEGDNMYGQTTLPPGIFALSHVSAGYHYSCGIKWASDPATRGAVVCWGINDQGQGSPPAGSFTAVSVSKSEAHTCGVRRNGELACWGDNTYGQATPPGGTFTQVSVGRRHSCGRRGDGAITCWGLDLYGQASPPAGDFTQVSAGDDHTCAIRNDGSIVCWGLSSSGQAFPPEGTFTQVSSGEHHSCGVRSDGTIVCWGLNMRGEASPPRDPWGGFEFRNGTSMAAPHVAGAWAVLRSKKPDATVDEILDVLRKTGKPIKDSRNNLIVPRINLAAALDALADNLTLTVNKLGAGGGTVVSVPVGIDCGNDCSEDYPKDTLVTLTATAAKDSLFIGWGGACAGSGTCAVTIDGSKLITATFAKSYPLMVNKTGTGKGTVKGLGIDCGNFCTKNFASDTLVTLSVTPDSGSTFTGWSGWSEACSGTGNCTVVMNSAKNVTANFDLSATNLPDLVVTSVTSPGSGVAGGQITVTAQLKNQGTGDAAADWLEFYLSPDSVITRSDIAMGYGCNIPVLGAGSLYNCSGPIVIPASLPAGPYYLGAYADSPNAIGESNETNNGLAANNTITVSTSGGVSYSLKIVKPTTGVVSSSPAGILCGGMNKACKGTFSAVTLTASPNAGYYFKNWDGCPGSGGPTCTLTLTKPVTIKAIFAQLPRYVLQVSKTKFGAITSEPVGLKCGNNAQHCRVKFVSGTWIHLFPVPQPGRTFKGWVGACAGDQLCLVEMNGNKTVGAIFQ